LGYPGATRGRPIQQGVSVVRDRIEDMHKLFRETRKGEEELLGQLMPRDIVHFHVNYFTNGEGNTC